MAVTKEGVSSMVDIVTNYKKGLLNLEAGIKALEYATGLPPDLCERLLRKSKRKNVIRLTMKDD